MNKKELYRNNFLKIITLSNFYKIVLFIFSHDSILVNYEEIMNALKFLWK